MPTGAAPLAQLQRTAVQLAGPHRAAAKKTGRAEIRSPETCPVRGLQPRPSGLSVRAASQMSIAPERVSTERRTAITMIASTTTSSIASPNPWTSDAMSIAEADRIRCRCRWRAAGPERVSSSASASAGIAALRLGRLVGRPRPGHVDLVGELSILGEDRYPLLGHRQEPTVHGNPEHIAVGLDDPGRKSLAQLGQQRRVSSHHADVAVHGPWRPPSARCRTRALARRQPDVPGSRPRGGSASAR